MYISSDAGDDVTSVNIIFFGIVNTNKWFGLSIETTVGFLNTTFLLLNSDI